MAMLSENSDNFAEQTTTLPEAIGARVWSTNENDAAKDLADINARRCRVPDSDC